MKRAYKTKRFGAEAQERIAQANEIIETYRAQGYSLTLRQLYYQFVSKALIPNRDREYKRLGELVNDARMAGLIDWSAIEDRTRHVRSFGGFDSPQQLMRQMANGYHRRKWEGQPQYAEVWIEKDALVGVLDRACGELDVPYFSCRGYVSASEMKAAADRLYRHVQRERPVTIFHLGDHDPSGLDMTRDIEERIFLFLAVDLMYDGVPQESAIRSVRELFRIERLALNMDQVEAYDPPPNPAKVTDSRAAGYIAEHGDESWELDALEPQVLADLVTEAVEGVIDREIMDAVETREEEEREQLTRIRERWDDVQAFLGSAS